MALISGFFRDDNGDRLYTAEVFASYFASFIGNGVFPNPSSGLQVVATSGRTVNIQPGKAWINGYFLNNTANYSVELDVADGTLSRIDRIVVQWNSDSRLVGIEVLRGTPAGNPQPPNLTRNNNIFELALADVRITNGLVNITQSLITDTRPNTNLCGFVTGVVQQVDTTTLFNQYQEVTLNNIAADQARFDAFLADLENALDGNVATALNNRVTNVENQISQNNDALADLFLSRGARNGLATLDDNGILTLSQRPILTMQRVLFNEPGTFNWTVPARVTTVSITGVGGGGGGGGANADGAAGGFTSFGTLLTLSGGGGGGAAGGAAGGFGATNGELPTNEISKGGTGGGSLFGQGAFGGYSTYAASVGRGAGGGGSFTTGSRRGGGGGAAGAINQVLSVTPGQSITITVGSGGSAGTGGNGNSRGGHGFLIINYIQ